MSNPFAPYGDWPHDPRETSQEHAARNRRIREQREIEREVLLEEQRNADLIEREQLRGITAPDY